ncbi:uracil-DNA glycosylase-like [Saccostrea echinata]|uniref:uracil-DNA glycosylase-like n=1 Tax=Saccostrea echinata TaxID=191078 RepID=UPI002A80141D|nr:uracil-DNA glycosylase-like [Saccostrea echinata]
MPGKRKQAAVKDDTAKRQKLDTKNVDKSPKRKQAKQKKSVVTSKKSDSGAVGSFSLRDLISNEKWRKALSEEMDKDYIKELQTKVADHYKKGDSVFPRKDLIFNALNMTPLDQIKVVILGQDPYHDDGQAMGLSFSVPKGVKVPPSLVNIYKELEKDPDIKGFKTPDHGNLESWAKNGVLLLNATLTVTAHQPNSHAKYGWQKLTDAIIHLVSEECAGVIFILWGGFAHKKEKLINQKKHAVIKTAHPSPLSFGKFINCQCFSKANSELKKFKKDPVNWNL